MKQLLPMASALVLGLASPGFADPFTDILDAQWSDEFHPAGFNGGVRAMLEWNGHLVVGGEFTACGSAPLVHIGSWDGERWEPLGAGLDGIVTALAEYKGDLIAGGTFTRSGDRTVSHVARWDGTAWGPLGDGVDRTVTALCAFSGYLVAGGMFTATGDPDIPRDNRGLPARPEDALNRLAWWNGEVWQNLGRADQLNGMKLRSAVHALTVYRFNLIAGVSAEAPDGRVVGGLNMGFLGWTPLGPSDEKKAGGPVPVMSAFLADGDRLVVAGSIPPIVYQSRHRMVTFDGTTWNSLDPGIDGPVRALAPLDEGFALAGDFGRILGSTSHRIAFLDGYSFTFNPGGGLDGRVFALASYRGELYVGGRFHGTGSGEAWYLARFRRGAWESTVPQEGNPLGAGVSAVIAHEGDLIVRSGAKYYRRDGSGWCPWPGDGTCPETEATPSLAAPFRFPSGYHAASNAVAFRGDLVVASGFSHPGIWDGSAWSRLPGNFTYDTAWGTERGYAHDFLPYGGNLIVGGSFDHIDGRPLGSIAVWDGQDWSPFSATGDISLEGASGLAVAALASWNDGIVAAGSFREAGGVSARGVAWWDGSRWQALGDGLDGLVLDVQVFRDEIYAGGIFEASGDDPSVRYAARWDGSAWVPLGAGIDGAVYDLAVYQDKLVVAGEFANAGGRRAGNIAFWDGSGWLPLGAGVDGAVNSVTEHDGDLWLGGEFWAAGGKSSPYVARWRGAVRASVENLDAGRGEGGVDIAWSSLVLPADHAGFRVYRQTHDLPRRELGGDLVTGTGPFSVTDPSPPFGETTYWLAGVSTWGAITWLESTRVDPTPGIPFTLAQNAPNPFTRATRIEFTLPETGGAVLRVFDVAGREVARPFDGLAAAGENQVLWDGTDAQGRQAASGVYFYRLETPQGTLTRRLLKTGGR